MDDMRPEFSFAVQENVFNLWYKFTTSKKERNAYLANVSPGIAGYDPRISVSKWYEKWMLIYVVHSVKATTLSNYVKWF